MTDDAQGPEFWIVLDQMGDGRVVGIFDSAARAERVVGEFSGYYKIHACRLNRIAPDVVHWSPFAAQREWLTELLREQDE